MVNYELDQKPPLEKQGMEKHTKQVTHLMQSCAWFQHYNPIHKFVSLERIPIEGHCFVCCFGVACRPPLAREFKTMLQPALRLLVPCLGYAWTALPA